MRDRALLTNRRLRQTVLYISRASVADHLVRMELREEVGPAKELRLSGRYCCSAAAPSALHSVLPEQFNATLLELGCFLLAFNLLMYFLLAQNRSARATAAYPLQMMALNARCNDSALQDVNPDNPSQGRLIRASTYTPSHPA